LLHDASLQQHGLDLLDEGSIVTHAESSGSRQLLQKQSVASRQWNQQRINNQRRRQRGGGGDGGDRRHLLQLQLVEGPRKALQVSSSSSSSSSRPLMVDVGGNVGWFSINAAAAGARVAMFEGRHILLSAMHSMQWCDS
jgi:hypothetical protein